MSYPLVLPLWTWLLLTEQYFFPQLTILSLKPSCASHEAESYTGLRLEFTFSGELSWSLKNTLDPFSVHPSHPTWNLPTQPLSHCTVNACQQTISFNRKWIPWGQETRPTVSVQQKFDEWMHSDWLSVNCWKSKHIIVLRCIPLALNLNSRLYCHAVGVRTPGPISRCAPLLWTKCFCPPPSSWWD